MDQDSLPCGTKSATEYRRYITIGFYTPVLLFYYYVIKHYDHIYENNSPSEVFNVLKRFRKYYFTGWNLSAQIYFMSIALADEISTLCRLPLTVRKMLHLVRRYLFTAIVFPCTLLVTTLFWSLYVLDRELVFPKSLDEYYLPWMVHSVHSFVVVPLIVETNLIRGNGREVVSFHYTLPLLTAFLLAYKITLLTIHLLYDVWLYPIFRYLSWWQRILFLAVLYFTAVMFLYFGIHLQHLRRRVKLVAVKNPTAIIINK